MSVLTAEPLSRSTCPKPIQWLWEPYLARGKLALLDGDPGIGKSLLTIDLAARLSRGAALPNGMTAGRPHVTLLLSAEEGLDTVRPRAEAAGADMDWIIRLRSNDTIPLRIPGELSELENQIRTYNADLVVIDPILVYLSSEIATNHMQSVRMALSPLAALAERTDCAILMVRHLRKSASVRAVLRGQGSMGIIAGVRTGLLVARHPGDAALSVLAVSKSNVAGGVPSLGFRVKSDAASRPVVEWVGPVNLSADTLCEAPVSPLRPRDRAAVWLQMELADGPRNQADVRAAAAEAGIPDRTLDRAKVEVGVRSHRVECKDTHEWYWYDPSASWPADAPFKKPFELPPLG